MQTREEISYKTQFQYSMDHFKVAISFQIIKFPEKGMYIVQHSYIIINATCEGNCVEFERKAINNIGFTTLTLKLPAMT